MTARAKTGMNLRKNMKFLLLKMKIVFNKFGHKKTGIHASDSGLACYPLNCVWYTTEAATNIPAATTVIFPTEICLS